MIPSKNYAGILRLFIKRCSMVFLAVCVLFGLNFIVAAHSGRTDEAGGHYDRSTGEYHYHHGYSEHQHYDMDEDGIVDCPYEFNDNTNTNNKTEINEYIISEQSNKLTLGEILIIILKIIGTTLFILLVALISWLFVYEMLHLLLSWFCEKVFKLDANTSTIDVIAKAIILVIAGIIASIIVLNSEGLL